MIICDIFFKFSIKTYVAGTTLEAPLRGASNEYPQHRVFMEKRTKSRNYHQILLRDRDSKRTFRIDVRILMRHKTTSKS